MVRCNHAGFVVCGVLNDFDHATDLRNNVLYDPSTHYRTGTLPFLAYELLVDSRQCPDHIARYDIESAIYVCVWDAVHYPGGTMKTFGIGTDTRSPLWSWTALKMFHILSSKAILSRYVQDLLVGDWEDYKKLITQLLFLLDSGRRRLAELQFEQLRPQEGSLELENLCGVFNPKDVQRRSQPQ